MRVQQLILCGCLGFLLTLVSGCGEAKPPLSAFSIDVDKNAQELSVRYTGPSSLTDCNISLNVKMEDGNVRKIDRYWAFWNEAKKVPLPKGGKVELVELTGTVVRSVNGQPAEQLQCHYIERFK